MVVTIVVLLILAGVTLNLVIGDNGLITKAKDAKAATEQAAINDQIEMNSLYEQLIRLETGTGGETGGGSGGSLPTGTGTTPYLPSDDFSQVSGTNLDTGLVIEDGEGNQYVWIEVPKTLYDNTAYNLDTSVEPNASKKPSSETDYDNIEFCLHKYTNTYRKSGYTDTHYADSTEGWFLDNEAYNTAKNKMLKSVYQNGGFWIGRYEAGISSPRTSKTDPIADDLKPTSKANEYPLTYVTRTQAKVLAERVSTGSYTSSLMFGVQWDLVLKHLENKGVTQAELKTNSSTWGNYSNSENLKITNENAKYAIYNQSSNTLGAWNSVPTNYTKPNTGTENWVLLTTGASDRNSLQNIYDLAGNVAEWTLEKTSETNYPCACRGGDYLGAGSVVPSSRRLYGDTIGSDSNTGFRLALY